MEYFVSIESDEIVVECGEDCSRFPVTFDGVADAAELLFEVDVWLTSSECDRPLRQLGGKSLIAAMENELQHLTRMHQIALFA